VFSTKCLRRDCVPQKLENTGINSAAPYSSHEQRCVSARPRLLPVAGHGAGSASQFLKYCQQHHCAGANSIRFGRGLGRPVAWKPIFVGSLMDAALSRRVSHDFQAVAASTGTNNTQYEGT
jgi:hypothetical protein